MTTTGQLTTDLTRSVHGPVYAPGSDAYDAERAGFQTAYAHRPALVVGAVDAADVAASVRFAAARGLPVAVQATGHGLTAAADGGVLVTTARMADVRIDPATRTARVGAGACWGQVVRAAAEHGLAPLNGSAPHVGVVGYTLGGGIGPLGRSHGYAADHVRAVELVTADGRARRVTGDTDPDLFWAVRGAGGNFGVVTALEFALFPVARLYGGGLYFPAERVPAVLAAYREWTRELPEELSAGLGLIPYPDLPMVPEPLRGRYVAHLRVAGTVDRETGERLLAPMRALGPPLLDSLTEMPYSECASIYQDPPQPHPYHGTSALLGELAAELPGTVLDLAGPDSALPCVVQLNHLGGALGRPPSVPDAVGLRGAGHLLRVLAVAQAPDGAGPDPATEAPGRLTGALAPWTVGRSVNFLFGGYGDADRVRECYAPGDYRRLAALKAGYDPADLFRFTHHIPPAR